MGGGEKKTEIWVSHFYTYGILVCVPEIKFCSV